MWHEKTSKTGKKIGIVIGRFEPLHNGHVQIIQQAMDENDLAVIVIGSARQAPTIKNPWSDHDRVAMIASCTQPGGPLHSSKKIEWISVQDHPYNLNAWLSELKIRTSKVIQPDDYVTLYGYSKDESSFYLKLFPEWVYMDVGMLSGGINATQIRQALFEGGDIVKLKESLPIPVYNYIADTWTRSESYRGLQAEYDFIKDYKAKRTADKYPRQYITVDAVIVYPGKVLVVNRKDMPGKGLLAMPGGFLGDTEWPLDSIIRIVKEKTTMNLQPQWMRNEKLFAMPDRSFRGRTVTQAFRFDMPLETKLNLNAGPEWIDIADLSLYSDQFFEDHCHILQEMTK